jgi:UDP-glucose 4-epimerase
MKKKIIVIGATGNTGVYLVDYMLTHIDLTKYEVVAAGRRKTNFFDRWNVEYHSVDISDKSTLDSLPKENVYAVVFEAGLLPAGMEGYHPEQYLNVNTIGALNVLEFCRENAVDRIIYTQTIREIGEYINTGVVLSPDLPRKFSLKDDHTVYTISKNAAVDMIEHYYQCYGLKRFIFRLPTIYDYGKSDIFYVDGKPRKKAYRLFMEKAQKGEPIELWGDPSKAHDVVYVKDFCQMLSKAVLADCEGGIYHVGTGIPVTLEEQIRGIIEVFAEEKKSEIIYCPDKPNARSYQMDISKAERDLGYKPQYSYLDYLKDFKKEMELDRFAELYK